VLQKSVLMECCHDQPGFSATVVADLGVTNL
jgi:hypothetical protein